MLDFVEKERTRIIGEEEIRIPAKGIDLARCVKRERLQGIAEVLLSKVRQKACLSCLAWWG